MGDLEPFYEYDTTFAIIVRGSFEDINNAVTLINDATELRVVYQRSSPDELYITEAKPTGE